MTEIKFECQHCESTVEEELLPMKHAVLGTLRMLNSEKECCESPEYTDSSMFHLKTQGKSLRDLMPGLA